MSVLELHAPVAPVVPRWAKVGPQLWVASTPLEFVGTVELIGDRYVACDRYAIPVGEFTDLDEAQRHTTEPIGRSIQWGVRFLAAAALIGAVAMIAWGVSVA